MTLESPHRLARATETRLHLIGDVKAAGGLNDRGGVREQTGRGKDAVARKDGVAHDRGDAISRPFKIGDGLSRLRRQHGGDIAVEPVDVRSGRSEEHTSELQSLMRISYAVFCL